MAYHQFGDMRVDAAAVFNSHALPLWAGFGLGLFGPQQAAFNYLKKLEAR